MKFQKLILFTALLLIGFVSACEDDDDHDHDHAEAEGFEILSGTTVLVSHYENEAGDGVDVTGSISVAAGSTLELTVVFRDHDGDVVELETDEFSVVISSASPALATVAMHDDHDHGDDDHDHGDHDHASEFEFDITGVAAGSTTLSVDIMHGNHADFESRPIPVTVN